MNTYKTILNNTGLKATKSRLGILEILKKQQKPLDVTEIAHQLAAKKISPDHVTIYRILEAFQKRKIVQRVELGEGKFRYELARNDHHHLICKKCGTIQDTPSCPVGKMKKMILQKQHFLVERHALEFFGLCKQCQSL